MHRPIIWIGTSGSIRITALAPGCARNLRHGPPRCTRMIAARARPPRAAF
jgi:hypothetical protein